MRDVILLYADADAALAASLAASNARVWITDRLSSSGATGGAFGPRFQLVVIWSAAAEAAGLAPIIQRLIAGRERGAIVLTVGDARAPFALTRHVDVFNRADSAGLHAALSLDHGTAEAAPRGSRMSSWAPRALAAAALSIGFGAVLAQAAAVDRAQPLDSEFGLAPLNSTDATSHEAAPLPAGEDAIEERVNSLIERARAEGQTPAARARAHTVAAFRASSN
jgi:hypothetical protein